MLTVQAGADEQLHDGGTHGTSGWRRRSVVLVALGALVVGAAGGWLARTATTRDLDDRVAAAELRLDTLLATPPCASPGPEASASACTPEVGATTPGTATTPDNEATSPAPAVTAQAPEVTRQAAYVMGTYTAGGTRYLTVDYVQLLTGEAAGTAAAAHGDESPPPNDYYIVNDSSLLRELPLAADVTVRVVTNADGSLDPAGSDLSAVDWVGRITGTDAGRFLSSLYRLTITDGTVDAIEEQYLP
ncbi:hypothetical protein DDP54_05965 [Cellulomonas sp. WB94]|uniref:hypothetical protein n=1 Tax=Cellulomonas sp. WB94 TaxID=2173174 RepID=UPI000D5831FA|nr:hypothetical protein [Cellulomonas sp. WB94]PVU82621.1 hypothetical protein DDP54_05965 [Cellulomonas sp. WB94]